MQTTLDPAFKDTADGIEAERILRNCVHCGFCLATCPSYQVLGNELDSPRGRIYLIKQLVEGAEVSAKTRLHLDRCLTCRNCETTCPSGVEYGKLLDMGRAWVETRAPRAVAARVQRTVLGQWLSKPALFAPTLKLGRWMRPLLPRKLRQTIPLARQPQRVDLASRAAPAPAPAPARRMIVLAGCVQPALAPNINAAATRVLKRLGIDLFAAPAAGCCGAVRFHLNDQAAGLAAMRRNIDAWLPHLDRGVEAIVMTASGCGVTVKDYAWHLRHDAEYAAKAARISAATRDLSEVLLAEKARLDELCNAIRAGATPTRLAFQSPCTLQHGQQVTGVVESLLVGAGFELCTVSEAGLCCGSAGTYSILQPEIAGALRTRKLANLQSGRPDVIVTANIGCLTHLQSDSATPVRHWIEVLDERLAPRE